MTMTQCARQLALTTPLGEDVLLLESMTGNEELSRGFRFELDLLSEDRNIDFDSIVGENVTIMVERAGGDFRTFSGAVNNFEHMPSHHDLARYRATVVPWLWFLTRRSTCRIFQNKTVPEILGEVFREYLFADFQGVLYNDHRTRDYCVQYRETDFDLVNRLMEEEGIYYFFEHQGDRHKLIFTDSPVAHDSTDGYEKIPFQQAEMADRENETIHSWRLRRKVQPSRFALKDFNFRFPGRPMDVKVQAECGHAMPGFEVYDYPGGYQDYIRGESEVRLRMEESQARSEVVDGESSARGIMTGRLFQLVDSPREDQNREYLVTAARYSIRSSAYGTVESIGAQEDATFDVSFAAIPARQPFRPRRITPRPCIQGPQTAIVVGKKDEEIWTDPHGRVKVQFHWDREGKADENSSCWVRVAQAWAGKGWGSIHIPRIGQEVVVEFLEGDPDRPLITGSVYNGSHHPPYLLPAEATISGVVTRSTRGGEGYNELTFEDLKGKERIFLHAQRDLDMIVEADRREWVLGRRSLTVEEDKLEHILKNRHEEVDFSHMERIHRDRNLAVGGKEAKKVGGSLSLQVGGDVIESFSADHSEDCSGEYSLSAGSINLEATTRIKLVCGGSSIEITPGGIQIETGGNVKVEGSVVQIQTGNAMFKGTITSQEDITAEKVIARAGGIHCCGDASILGSVQAGKQVVTPSVIAASYSPGAGNVM